MDRIDDLKILKKHYGENFAHLCRKLFPTLLETEGLLSKVILEHFDESRTLYDAVRKEETQFKRFVEKCVTGGKEKEFAPNLEHLTPKQLLAKAGYTLYDECKSDEQLQSFKKYYAPGEALCSFGEKRLKTCRVWFAVKKGATSLDRESFEIPERQDEYGTSVISIQFAKADGSVSIKNRYNHKVFNPDATFGNNLDHIIPGLAKAFEETYGLAINTDKVEEFSLDGYEMGEDGRYYKVQAILGNEIYCENNTVLSYGRVMRYDKSRYLLIDNYLIDFESKTIKAHANFFSGGDSVVKSIGEIETMTLERNKDGNRVVVIKPKEGDYIEITINQSNAIIGYSNPNATEVGDHFMDSNRSLTYLYMPKLKKAGFNFLSENRVIKNVSLESLEDAGEYFMANANATSVYMPSLKYAQNGFMIHNTTLKELSLPNAEIIGMEFFKDNISLKRVDLPKARDIEDEFMENNNSVEELSLPSARWLAPKFMQNNRVLKKLYLPQAEGLSTNIVNRFGNIIIRDGNSNIDDLILDDIVID